jgi:putative oxidoreductase
MAVGMDFQQLETVWAPRVLGLLRIVTALLFMEHGSQKLLGFPAGDHGSPELFSLIWFAGFLELVGGFFILIGLFTRPVAFLLSGEMAFAYWMAHAPKAFFPALNGGDGAILFCFIFLYFAFKGPGAFSADAMRGAGSIT